MPPFRGSAMKYFLRLAVAIIFFSTCTSFGQEKTDSTTIAQIKDEGTNRSQLMEILRNLTDVRGPRLTYSPGVGAKITARDQAQLQLREQQLSILAM